MSLCYDFEKWTIMTMLAIVTVCLVGVVNLVYGQTPEKSFNKIINEAVNASTNLTYIDDPATPWNETADPERTEAEIEKRELKDERELKQQMIQNR